MWNRTYITMSLLKIFQACFVEVIKVFNVYLEAIFYIQLRRKTMLQLTPDKRTKACYETELMAAFFASLYSVAQWSKVRCTMQGSVHGDHDLPCITIQEEMLVTIVPSPGLYSG